MSASVIHADTQLQADIAALGPWFHNLHLPNGVQTAPGHRFGDFPRFKWEKVAAAVPADLSGWTVLDIGCNAGFYSFELAKRGARVVGLDVDEHYLSQARWAAQQFGFAERVRFELGHVFELARWPQAFDLVWFTGVFYHLRYPTLALDLVRERCGRMMMFQSMTMPGEEVAVPPPDLALEQRAALLQPGWPKMAFIERRLADDATNWWAPNHACVEALLRSAGFKITARPEHEFYFCEIAERTCAEEFLQIRRELVRNA